MKKITLLSWNVNGIRAMDRKGILDWLSKASPEILCLQETKAHPTQLREELRNPNGYMSYWHLGERKGYSGVGVYSKIKPLEIKTKFSSSFLSNEGRTMMLDYGDFLLFNCYCPNGKKNQERLEYKMNYYKDLLILFKKLQKQGRKIILTGDVNTAHQEIDLARPKANSKTSGFLPQERQWIDELLFSGFIDTLREFHFEPNIYTWWDMKTHARDRNVGWRIDYFFISQNLKTRLIDAFTLPDVMGSDHCPVGITLQQ